MLVSLRDGTLDVGHDVPFLCAWLLIRIGHHGLFGLFNYVLRRRQVLVGSIFRLVPDFFTARVRGDDGQIGLRWHSAGTLWAPL